MAQQPTTLADAISGAEWIMDGHGPRNVQVLKEALEQVDVSQASDMYGRGEVIERFERKMAELLGKESAVFFPSGTMAQQIALRIWCDRRDLPKVAYHPLSHLELHEQDGLKKLHHITPLLLADKDRLITLEDIKALQEDISCLLLELPQREIGGQLPPFGELEAISAYCRENGIRLHLDGARLLEILPYYEKTAAEVCALFDSVYVSFYKGIGGVAGAILAGDKDFTQEAVVWKRRHGGDLISLYPYIISADYYYEKYGGRMARYYEYAKELAALYNGCEAVKTLPEVPVSNMFHVHIAHPKEQVEPLLIELTEETGVAIAYYVNAYDDQTSSYEVSLGERFGTIPKDKLAATFQRLNEKLKALGRG
ncbi:threonine aldolase [Paenibacillus yonginensis]|uniref:Threonine aldolase n=1 Tax=Paenibacillus yonginensis TaxID=1462996 RepID=A0A1B1N442_9BACL|nr:aminotransferase class I/II-fold pyridoxal phosphate-dependent enzyme [Paenibacillus yonginensis]ANS76218.1 threonine aldolase [Paenibacillus yonginensis]